MSEVQDNSTGMGPSPMPKTARYSDLIQRATPASKFIRRFSATTGSTYSEQNPTCRIPIAVPAGGFLSAENSMVQLTLDVTATGTSSTTSKAAMQLDEVGIEGLIESVQLVGSEGTVLEDVRFYNVYSTLENQHGKPLDSMDIDHGLNGGMTQVFGIKSSAAVFDFAASTSSKTVSRTFAFNPRLAMFRTGHQLPLGFVQGSPITLVLNFAKAAQGLVNVNSCTAVSYTVKNVSVLGMCIFYPSEVTATVQSLMASIGGIQVAGQAASNIGVASIAGTGSVATAPENIALACRVRSLNQLLAGIYQTSNLASATAYSLSNRRRMNLKSYQYSLGGEHFPPTAIQVSTTNETELIQQIKMCGSTVGGHMPRPPFRTGNSHIGVSSAANGDAASMALVPNDDTSVTSDGTTTLTEFFSNFYLPLDMTSYGAGADIGNLEHGLNTSASTSTLELKMDIGHSSPSTVFVYALSTMIITFLSDGRVVTSV